MASRIRSSIEDLPHGEVPARPPSSKPLVVNLVVDTWYRLLVESGDLEYKPAIPGRKYRASNAGLRCDRSQYYSLTNTDKTQPPSIADIWRMKLGNLVHDGLGHALQEMGDGWRTEVIVDLMAIGVDGSSHADLVRFVCIQCGAPITVFRYPDDEPATTLPCRCSAGCSTSTEFHITRTEKGEHTWDPAHEKAADVSEFKTINGYGFKQIATTQGGPPVGARFSHIIQGAISADALGCDRLTVAYLSMENVSPGMAASYVATGELGRFTAEWHFLVSDMRATLDAEYERIRRLQACAELGARPARELHDSEWPAGAMVTDPKDGKRKGLWVARDPLGNIVDQGEVWLCQYCDWRDRCKADGPEAVSVEVSI
jgi:hypothetical protein